MSNHGPHVIVLGGPNGSGKSTAAGHLLHGTLAVSEFVNADTVAQGLSAFDPDRSAVQAGRIMLARLRELADRQACFAFEITLAGRSFAPWIKELTETGYTFHLVYLWVPSPEMAIARVAERVRMGGHNVPEETIRRRYHTGLKNFFGLYRPLAATWHFYDNSLLYDPRLVATGCGNATERVLDPETWNRVLGHLKHE